MPTDSPEYYFRTSRYSKMRDGLDPPVRLFRALLLPPKFALISVGRINDTSSINFVNSPTFPSLHKVYCKCNTSAIQNMQDFVPCTSSEPKGNDRGCNVATWPPPAPLFDFVIETHILQEIILQRNKVVKGLSAGEIDGASIYERFEMTSHRSRAPISISEETEHNPGNIISIIALVSLHHQWLLQHSKHMCTWHAF